MLPAVRRNRVLVWRVDLPLAVATDWLDEAERRRAAAFRLPADRDRFVLGRSMLRALLARELGVPPAAVPLAQRAGAPPELVGRHRTRLRWSVSHSGSIVLVALARRAVGVDVEHAGAGRHWVRAEAAFKARQRTGRCAPWWRVAWLPVGAQHRAAVVAPGLWRLCLLVDGPALPVRARTQGAGRGS